jgi:hypothetical protein
MTQIFKISYDIVNSSSNKIVLFLKNSINILIDVIINGIKFKSSNSVNVYYYYKYINLLLIASIFGALYFLNTYYNLFGIKNTQYEILGAIVLFGIGIFYFLFLVFRNNKNNIINSDDRLKLNNSSDKTLSSNNYDTEDYTINNINIKTTYVKPLGYLFMYVGLLFFILVATLFTINYILYSQKNSNAFSITQSLIGIIITIVILAIIAVIFSIKSSNTSDDCYDEQNKSLNYFCIIKKVIFFIPCLLIIFIDEINKDIKLTPNSIYLLLFILLMLITLLFILPSLFLFN